MNIGWDGGTYAENYGFVSRYGEDVLTLIAAERGALVCDLGCGTGALTEKIRQRGYRVVGVDASASMLKKAAADYPDLAWIRDDALQFRLEERADVVFSNSVFHWIAKEDQPALLSNVARNLKDGGQLVCEFGGSGCAQSVHAALNDCFERRGLRYVHPHYFPTIGQYAALLEEAGFRVTYASLFRRPTRLKEECGIRGWIETFLPAPFSGIGEGVRREILSEAETALKPVLFRDGAWFVDYVRVRFSAVKR